MTLKRSVLLILTFLSLIPFFFSLIGSLSQPQVQANLQIYQTDFILQASEFDFQTLAEEAAPTDLEDLRYALLGKSPYSFAQEQYLEGRKLANKNLASFQSELNAIPLESLIVLEGQEQEEKLKQEISRERKFINKLNLKLGLLQVQQENSQEAIETWESLILPVKEFEISPNIQETAKVLKGLWSQPLEILPNAESQIAKNLTGWFRYRALQQLYQVQNHQDDLLNLQDEEQKTAKAALIKLAILNGIPVLGGISGFVILIFLLVQLLLKPDRSILAHNSNNPWKTPWNAEIIWQVLIVGFFFWGQILLPVFFGILGSVLKVDLTSLDLREKAVYVLFNYLSLAVGGLLVLYFSVKPFFPLDKDWFRFKWLSNWSVWGFGGYLVALPLVLIVSLVNQQFWDGQGGSNPLLFLALESQDYVVLAIFFFTASVAAPLYEEMLFRGFLLPSLTRYFPVWSSILISSLVFAAAHGNLSEIIPLVTLGIILGITYTRSRNLLASILLHSLWNSGTLLSLFVLGSGVN